jgi:hypothetical protein
MVMALSRPAADDFALSADQLAESRHGLPVDSSKAGDPTQVEGMPPPRRSTPVDGLAAAARVATQNAATLAAEDVELSQPAINKTPGSLAGNQSTGTQILERPSRFTTLDEEEARLRAQQRRSWVQIAGQLTALATVLALMVALAMYIRRTPSADELYATITERGDDGEHVSLVTIEPIVNEFLKLYPADPRAREIERFRERIELDKLERRQRRLRREARENGAADTSLLPAEQIYLRAMDAAETSPDGAAALLQSLVDLYGPGATGEAADEDVAAIVALANRRLKTLRDDVDKMHERQLSVLRKRLEVAEQRTKTEPAEAKRMYQAIIDLHADDVWAGEVVAEARAKLGELNP